MGSQCQFKKGQTPRPIAAGAQRQTANRCLRSKASESDCRKQENTDAAAFKSAIESLEPEENPTAALNAASSRRRPAAARSQPPRRTHPRPQHSRPNHQTSLPDVPAGSAPDVIVPDWVRQTDDSPTRPGCPPEDRGAPLDQPQQPDHRRRSPGWRRRTTSGAPANLRPTRPRRRAARHPAGGCAEYQEVMQPETSNVSHSGLSGVAERADDAADLPLKVSQVAPIRQDRNLLPVCPGGTPSRRQPPPPRRPAGADHSRSHRRSAQPRPECGRTGKLLITVGRCALPNHGGRPRWLKWWRWLRCRDDWKG